METETEISLETGALDMRALAEQADNARFQDGQEISAEPENRAPEGEINGTAPEVQADNSETDPAKGERKRDPATGQFVKTEAEIAAETKVEAAKPVSEYEAKKQEKARKENDRLEKTWENVNARKIALDQHEAALRAKELQLSQPPKPQLQVPRMEDGTPITSKDLFKARNDFRAAAKQALADGDYDTFNAKDKLAEQAEEHGIRVAGIEREMFNRQAFEKHQHAWVTNMQETIQKVPELAKADDPLSQIVQELLKTNQVFEMLPDGFAKAVEIGKLRMEAGSASELREANKKLQAEVDRLNGLTGVKGGGVTTPPSKKEFNEMSIEEMGKNLRRMAESAGTIGSL